MIATHHLDASLARIPGMYDGTWLSRAAQSTPIGRGTFATVYPLGSDYCVRVTHRVNPHIRPGTPEAVTDERCTLLREQFPGNVAVPLYTASQPSCLTSRPEDIQIQPLFSGRVIHSCRLQTAMTDHDQLAQFIGEIAMVAEQPRVFFERAARTIKVLIEQRCTFDTGGDNILLERDRDVGFQFIDLGLPDKTNRYHSKSTLTDSLTDWINRICPPLLMREHQGISRDRYQGRLLQQSHAQLMEHLEAMRRVVAERHPPSNRQAAVSLSGVS